MSPTRVLRRAVVACREAAPEWQRYRRVVAEDEKRSNEIHCGEEEIHRPAQGPPARLAVMVTQRDARPAQYPWLRGLELPVEECEMDG